MSDSGPIRVEAGEWTTDEFLSALDDGRRVIVLTEFMGDTREVAIRWDGETYYCDSPTRLYRHETPEGFADCLRKLGYTADSPDGAAGDDAADAVDDDTTVEGGDADSTDA